MKRQLSIIWLCFLVISIVNCKSDLNLNEKESHKDALELSIPNPGSSDTVWQLFFENLGASKFWKIIRFKRGALDIQLKEINNPTTGKCNKIIESIIQYLACKGIAIKELTFAGIKGRPDISLTAVPSIITRLNSLEKLYLPYNQIKVLPADLGKLTNLNLLDLSYNHIAEIPEAVFLIPNLESLRLCFNQISTIPTVINNLKKLQVLILRNNQIMELPEMIELTKLRNLDLSNNRFKIFPVQITELTNLESISLSFNHLKKLPAEITKLVNLKIFQLNHNRLELVEKKLFNLPKLRTIELSSNQLESLPASVSELIATKKFSVLLNNNPWFQIRNPKLKQLTAEQISECCNPSPHNLCLLCIRYLKEKEIAFDMKDIDAGLPVELQKPTRNKKLQEAYQWKEGENIVFFRQIENGYIPFYLDPVLNSYDAIKNMFEEFREETFYQITDNVTAIPPSNSVKKYKIDLF